MTIDEMEKARSVIEEKQMGLGHFDKEIVNFLVDDDETAVLKKTRESVFNPNKPKENMYDYLFE